jgi:nitrogen fixation protein FixH
MNTMPQRPPFRFTGWHMTGIMVAFFGVVIAVNVWMATLAVTSFTGTVVDNGYVASQSFNRWLAQASHDKALGWSAAAHRMADGTVRLTLAGKGTEGAVVSARAIQPLDGHADRELAFARTGDGTYLSTKPLTAVRWRLLVAVAAGGQSWHGEVPLS